MGPYKGDFTTSDTVYVFFDTFSSDDPSASITLTGLAVTDIEIYKNGSVTQRSSDAGYTLLDTDGIDFDTITGIHGFSIDLSDNTDAGFYTSGGEFDVIVSAVTVDAATINFHACSFSIGRTGTKLNTIASDLVQIYSDTTIISSQTTVIESDSIKVESNTEAIHSQTTVIESDSIKVESNTEAIHSQTTVIESDSIKVESNTEAIHSDTTIIASDVVQVYSDTTILVSDTTAIHSQTTVIESDSITIQSSLVVVESQTTVIESDVTRLELGLIVATGALEGTPSSTILQTDLAEATDDHYNNMVFMMTSGDEAGESRRISDYTGVTGTVTLDTALSGSPTAAETFVIINAVSTGGSLTAAQDSKLTRVQSDVILVYSDTTAIHSETTVIQSDTTAIHSQTTVIESDSIIVESSVQVVESQTTVIESDSIKVESNTEAIHSQTTVIESDSITIQSSLVVVESQTTVIESNTEAIHSQTTVIESDSITVQSSLVVVESQTTVIESNTEAIHSQTTVIESDSIVISSDTAVIEGVAPANRIAVAVTFTSGTTTTAVLGNVDGSAASTVDDYYNGRVLIFNSGTLANQATDITDYTGATKTATITQVTTAVTSSHTAEMV